MKIILKKGEVGAARLRDGMVTGEGRKIRDGILANEERAGMTTGEGIKNWDGILANEERAGMAYWRRNRQDRFNYMKNRIRLVFIILIFVWMGVIFVLSSRPASLSSQDSYRVGKLFSELFVPGFKEWSAESQDRYIRSIDRPIRKAAHASEYAILAVLVSGLFIVQSMFSGVKDNKIVRHLAKGVGLSALFACSDEFHQTFVNGRAGSLLDVCIDTAGALIGVIFLGLMLHICKRLVAAIRKTRTGMPQAKS